MLTFVEENSQHISLHVFIRLDVLTREYYISKFFRITNSEKRIEQQDLDFIIEESEYIEIDDKYWNNGKKLSKDKSKLFQEDVLIYNNSYQGVIDIMTASFKYAIINLIPSSIYSIQVEKLKAPARLKANEESIRPDASNLVSFMESIRHTNPTVIQQIEKDLYRFTKEFASIRLVQVTGELSRMVTLKKIELADKDDKTFSADQLSEGVLYFLTLLAIIHQPNPPHLLMLEEPEKGIHPRRIKEIIELIFYLAKEKGIRVILTTHSTYVVDEFSDVPEGVHIVDKIDYLSSLGEHWSIGFLGGVPE